MVIILDGIGFQMVAPLLAPMINAYSHAHALSYFFYGLIISAYPLAYMLSAPILGQLSDRLGRKKIMIACFAGLLIGFGFYLWSFITHQFFILLLGRVFAGFAAGSQGIAQAAMADKSDGRARTINISTIAIAMSLGLVLGPLISAIFSNHHIDSWFNPLMPFYFVIVLTVINLIFVMLFIRESNKYTKNDQTTFLANHFIANLKALLKPIQLRRLLVIFFLFECAWSLYFQSLPLILVKMYHANSTHIGLTTAFVGASLSLSLGFIVRWLARRVTLQKMISISLMLGIISYFLGYAFTSQTVQLILAIPITTAVAISYSAMISYASSITPANHQGILMGTTDALLALAFTLTGIASSVMVHHESFLPYLGSALLLISGSYLFRRLSKTLEIVNV